MKRFLLALITMFFCTSLYSQSSSNLIKIIQDIDSAKTKIGDTVKIRFQNVSKKQLSYTFEIRQLRDTAWYYNPFYTQYYNHELSYKQLKEMFSHHLPVVPSQNWSVEVKEIQPKQFANIMFIVKKKQPLSNPVRVRINIFGDDKIIGETIVDNIDSAPFPFVLINE